MIRSIQYQLDLTQTQRALLAKSFGCCRFIYNFMLNRKIEAYKEDKTSLSCFDLCKELTKLKKHSEYIWLKEVTTESLKKLVCHCLNADIKGSLEQIGKSWKLFEHKGKPMTKKQVKCVLNYALSKGYTNTGQLTDAEVDHMITPIEF